MPKLILRPNGDELLVFDDDPKMTLKFSFTSTTDNLKNQSGLSDGRGEAKVE